MHFLTPPSAEWKLFSSFNFSPVSRFDYKCSKIPQVSAGPKFCCVVYKNEKDLNEVFFNIKYE